MHKALFGYALLIPLASAISAQQTSQPAQSVSEPNKPTIVLPYYSAELPPYVDGLPKCAPVDDRIHPLPDGVYRIGHGVSSPKPIKTPEAKFSDEALDMMKEQHLSHFEAVSLMMITVDAEGKTKDLCLIRPAGYGLDGQAARAVETYRFHPAKMNDKPVSVRMVVQVDFKH
ncbi:MAG: energy transducer TonB [Terracidiphilus sp.]